MRSETEARASVMVSVARACAGMLLALTFAVTAVAAEPATSAMTRVAELSAQRLLLADTVAASKRASGKPVEDAAREHSQLDRLGAQAASRGVSRDQSDAFFKAQIEANKLVQYRLLAQPSRRRQAAIGAIDLEPVRARLDEINQAMLDALAPALREARAEDCVLRAYQAQEQAARRHRLDALHRTALARSFGDICRSP